MQSLNLSGHPSNGLLSMINYDVSGVDKYDTQEIKDAKRVIMFYMKALMLIDEYF